MCSPVISASGTHNRSILKGLGMLNGKPCQLCDIVLQIEKDLKLSGDFNDVRLCMLGAHQLQNATTAVCAALCLRDQGWRISDVSIRAGLESTSMLGRGQILSFMEAQALGLPGSTIMLDGAHTKESAKALVDTVQMTFPQARVVFVVAMASDKDHMAFAGEILKSKQLEAVFLTEVDIAGGKSRTSHASFLKECWIQASKALGGGIVHDEMSGYSELLDDRTECSAGESEHKIIAASGKSLLDSMRDGNQILKERSSNESSIIVVTGSLHAVSSVLASLH